MHVFIETLNYFITQTFAFFELLCNLFLPSDENPNYSSYSKILNILEFWFFKNSSYCCYSKALVAMNTDYTKSGQQ